MNLKPKTTECYDGEQVAYVPLQDPEGGPSVVIAILEAARRTAKAEVFWSHCKSAIPANLLDCRRRDSGGSGSPLYHVSVSLRPPGMRPQFGKH